MTSIPTVSRPLALGLLTGLTALLAGCGTTGKAPAPTPTPTEVGGLILGQITPFTPGDASSVYEGSGSAGGSLVDASGTPLTAPVNDQGLFSLGLPKVATMTAAPDASLLFTVPDVFGACENSQTSAPSGLRVYPITYLTTDTGKRIVSEIDPSKANLNYRTWWFSNLATTVKYSGNCIGLGAINTTFALKRGWNLIVIETNPGVSTTYTASTQPTTPVPWQYASSSMGAAALKAYPNLLTPWKNLPQYQNR
jgi:hypothetical protein